MNPIPNKQLGQHWLRDEASLDAMLEAGEVKAGDEVLEIGPGLGTLTKKLLEVGAKVVAVEFDPFLAGTLPSKLPSTFRPQLTVTHADILKFDLGALSAGYKIVANIPYYLTSHLLRIVNESANPPARMTLLVQKEVAERICAAPGSMSLLSVSCQLYNECTLGREVPKELFTPPPEVDSQIVVLARRALPLFADIDTKVFFQIVKAGFGERRKMLRGSLSSGLRISKPEVDQLCERAGIDSAKRAQELSLEDWYAIYKVYTNT